MVSLLHRATITRRVAIIRYDYLESRPPRTALVDSTQFYRNSRHNQDKITQQNLPYNTNFVVKEFEHCGARKRRYANVARHCSIRYTEICKQVSVGTC